MYLSAFLRLMPTSVAILLISVQVGGISLAQSPDQLAQSSDQSVQTGFLKRIVAVSRFENRSSYQGGGEAMLTNGLADQLTDALVRNGSFIVLERLTLTDVLDEQDLVASGAASQTEAARTGQIIGAQILIKGTVTEFEAEAKSSGGGLSVGGFRMGRKKSVAHVGIIIRLIDASTAEVLSSHYVEGEAEAKRTTFDAYVEGIDFDSESFKKAPLGKATQQVIDEAVEIIAAGTREMPFEARVIRVSGNEILISAGARNNVTPGMQFVVTSLGEEIVDPFTGERLGFDSSQIGRIQVSRVQDRFAFAKPLGELNGIKAGDVVSFTASAQ